MITAIIGNNQEATAMGNAIGFALVGLLGTAALVQAPITQAQGSAYRQVLEISKPGYRLIEPTFSRDGKMIAAWAYGRANPNNPEVDVWNSNSGQLLISFSLPNGQ